MDLSQARLEYLTKCWTDAKGIQASAQRLQDASTSQEGAAAERSTLEEVGQLIDILESMIDELTQSMSAGEIPEYHGMPHELVNENAGIPDVLDHSGQVYKEVLLYGNYTNKLCTRYQQFTRYNVNYDQITKIGWEAFGFCPWNYRIVRV